MSMVQLKLKLAPTVSTPDVVQIQQAIQLVMGAKGVQSVEVSFEEDDARKLGFDQVSISSGAHATASLACMRA